MRYRKRSPENSRAGALAYESALRQKMARGESIGKAVESQQQVKLFEQFAEQWFEEYVIPNNKHSVQRTKKYILASLLTFFGKIPITEISSQHIEQFKARLIKKGLANKTINNHLSVLQNCLSTAEEWLKLPVCPPKVKWLKCPPPPTEYLSPEECELLLSNADGVVYDMILMALRTGMRQGEIKGLQWSSINWENRSIVVRHSKDDRMKLLVAPKSNRERHIPLDTHVYDCLYKRKRSTGYVFLDEDGQPFDYHRMERRLTKVCKQAGLRKIGWHKLRHTFASHLAMNSEPLPAIQMLLGHATITTTMRYAHIAPSTLRGAIDRLDPKFRLRANFGQPVGNAWMQTQQHEMAQKTPTLKNP